jgi:hypothetical protein
MRPVAEESVRQARLALLVSKRSDWPGHLGGAQIRGRLVRPWTVTLHTFKIPVGNFQDFGDTKIEVREVRKHISRYPSGGEYEAVLWVNSGGALVFWGRKARKTSTNCYYLPIHPLDSSKAPHSN